MIGWLPVVMAGWMAGQSPDAGATATPSMLDLFRPEADLTAGLIEQDDVVDAVAALKVGFSRELASIVDVGAVLTGQLTANGGTFGYGDLGSEVTLRIKPHDGRPADGLTLELFPLDSQRVRPTFDFADVWGRFQIFNGPTPAVRVSADWAWLHVWGAVKAGQAFSTDTFVPRIGWGGLGGGTVRLPFGLAVEVIGADLDMLIRSPEFTPLGQMMAQPSNRATGFSGRLRWDWGGGVEPFPDFITYGSDPERFERLLAPETLVTDRAVWLAFEGGTMSEPLSPPVVNPVRIDTRGVYFDAQARVKVRALRLFATVRYRSAEAVAFDLPAQSPPSTFPSDVKVQGRMLEQLGVEYGWSRWGVTVGALGRLVQPAMGGIASGQTGQGAIQVAFNEDGLPVFLAGSTVQLSYGLTGMVRFDALPWLSALAELDYFRDNNHTRFVDATNAPDTFVAAPTDAVRLFIVVQARY